MLGTFYSKKKLGIAYGQFSTKVKSPKVVSIACVKL